LPCLFRNQPLSMSMSFASVVTRMGLNKVQEGRIYHENDSTNFFFAPAL
jgi:hypothetical protein